MTSKTQGTKDEARGKTTAPPRDDLQTAYQIHTLAQIVYGQFMTGQPWAAPTLPMTGPAPMHDPHLGAAPPGWPMGMWTHPWGWGR